MKDHIFEHLHYVWFARLRKERLVVDGKLGKQKLFQSLVQGNNENGKKVTWEPVLKKLSVLMWMERLRNNYICFKSLKCPQFILFFFIYFLLFILFFFWKIFTIHSFIGYTTSFYFNSLFNFFFGSL